MNGSRKYEIVGVTKDYDTDSINFKSVEDFKFLFVWVVSVLAEEALQVSVDAK